MKAVSLLGGALLYALVLLLGYSYDGGHVESLLHPTALFIVALAPWVALCTAYGMPGAFRLLGSLFRKAPAPPEAERFLDLWIASAHRAGALVFLLELFVASGFLAGKPWVIAGKVMAGIAGPLFALVLAEGVLRPLKHRLAREAEGSRG